MKTDLKDRILWYDGTVQVSPELVPLLFLHGVKPEKIVVTQHNEDTLQFNSLEDIVLTDHKSKNDPIDLTWNIPQFYLDINLLEYLNEKLIERNVNTEKYKNRLMSELTQVELRGMGNFIRSLIYVVDMFKQSNTLWGVGRGSSCASLILYLIQLHEVDPVKFNISQDEFFHD